MTEAERDLLILLAHSFVVLGRPENIPMDKWEEICEGIRFMTRVVMGVR